LQIEKREISPVELELTVTVPAEEMAARVEEALREAAPKMKVPGFRPGHVPRKIVWQRFGDAITAEAVDKSLQKYYRAALDEAGIEPVSPGTMQDVSYKEGQPLTFKVKIEKAPDFELPDISDITVELEQPQVSQEDVLQAIDQLREQQAVLTPTDEPVDEDSVLVVDIQEIDQAGLPIIGRVRRDVQLDMRRNPFGKDFAERAMGTRVGAHILLVVNEGARAQPEKKTVTFDIEVKSVQRKELPPFDDAFAASINPEAPTAKELEEDLRRSLTARAAAVARRKMHDRLIDSLLHKLDFPVPPRMLDDYLERLVRDSVSEDKSGSAEDPAEIEKLKEDYRAVGIRNIRWYLVRSKLVSSQDLKPTEEDIEHEMETLAKVYGKPRREIDAIYAAEDKRHDLMEAISDRKLFASLERRAKVIPVPVDLATFEGRAPSRIVTP
jgi:trigger factor